MRNVTADQKYPGLFVYREATGAFRGKPEKLYKVIYSKNGHRKMTIINAIPTTYFTPPLFHWGINSLGEEVFWLLCQLVMHCLRLLIRSEVTSA